MLPDIKNALRDPLVTSTPWVTRIGHELTFMPRGPFSEEAARSTAYRDGPVWDKVIIARDLLRACQWPGRETTYITTDSSCIEVTHDTPAKSWRELLSWNYHVRRHADAVGLTPQVDYHGGGMGHHHIDIPENPAVTIALFRFLAARPYLAWLFVNPADYINAGTCNSWWHEHRNSYRATRKMPGRYFLLGRMGCDDRYGVALPEGRGYALTLRLNYTDTIEWRAFDSAATMEEQIEHTAFLQRLVGYAMAHPDASREPLYLSDEDAKDGLKQHRQYRRCVAGVRQTMDTLGLPMERYEKYLTNIRYRLLWGYIR